jgi:bacterioferritin-associated ferredoxin
MPRDTQSQPRTAGTRVVGHEVNHCCGDDFGAAVLCVVRVHVRPCVENHSQTIIVLIEIFKAAEQPMYVCICSGVTERQVNACLSRGVASLEDLACHLGVGAGCGRCRELAAKLIDEHGAKGVASSPALEFDSSPL